MQYSEVAPPGPPVQQSYDRPSQYYSTHIGPTTELEPILLDLSSSNSTTSLSDGYQKSDNRTAFLVDHLGAERSKAANLSALGAVERLVDSYGPILLQTYFTTTHRSFPIIEEGFFSDYESGRRSNLDPGLLAAIYALTVPYLARDPSIIRGPLPDPFQLEDLSFRLFGESLYKPTLSTIQCGIILLQRPNNDSKALNSQLVSAAYELGLHLDCTSWSTSTAEKALRKRLAWALYMQDKWCSLIHGRPSAISTNNWAVKALTDEDFGSFRIPSEIQNDEEVNRGRALFKEMVTLTQILSTVLDTFYTLRAMQEVEDAGQGGTRLILERAKPVQIRLKEWFAGLPSNLKMDNTMTGKPSSTGTKRPPPPAAIKANPQPGYLHLAYFATEITLHRCIIRSLETSNNDAYLAHICRSAAKTRLISAMDFVNRLRPEHLTAFWYFPSRVNFALIGTFGSLLLATAPCQEEVEFYRTRLNEYRWTLSVSAKTVDFLQFAVKSLDSSSTLLQNLPRRPSTAEIAKQMQSNRSIMSTSPPIDENMTDAPPLSAGGMSGLSLSMGGSGGGGGGMHNDARMAGPSGLVSPSTSTSSGSTSYEAYAEMFPTHRTG
jgi:hypothetical protein